MEKKSAQGCSAGRSNDVIVITKCCSPNCPGNASGGVSGAAADVASAVASAVCVGASTEYDSLCECSERDEGVCRCRQQQINQTSWLRPQNWPYWPTIKRVLIGLAVTFVLVWLIVYLVLHFYVQAL